MSQNNMGDLTRSSSASKAMRNMGINPGVQAKLMAFQAKRQQQIQQSKSNSNLDSNDNDYKLDTSMINNFNDDSNNNNNNNDDNDDDDDDDLINISPLDSKINPLNFNSPSTPLSFNSSTFSSPIISPNDEKKSNDCLSRRTSFRLNNNINNINNNNNNNGNGEIIRRTSFRLNKSSSATSSSTISDDSEDISNNILNINNINNNNSDLNSDLKRNNSLDKAKFKNSNIYPVNKNLSYISKIQNFQSQSQSQSQSNSSSLDSISSAFSSKPPSKPLPSIPILNDQSNSTIINQNQNNISSQVNLKSINDNPKTNNINDDDDNNNHNPEHSPKQTFNRHNKLSLSQRRGMKLNLDALNNNITNNTNNNIANNDTTCTNSITNKSEIKSVSSNDFNNLKNQMNKLSLNGSPKKVNNSILNNRQTTNMNKLRNSSLPNRRKPMSLNLNGLDIHSRPNQMRQNLNTSNNTIKNNNSNDSTSNNQFTPFAKYVDIKSGSLNFAGKASLHSKGIDFSNGSSFRISMDDLEILEELGHGNYGVVSKVLHKPTGIIMAMKEVRLELDDSKFRQILMELEVLHSCNSDCIVEFYGAFFVEGAVYMCMEYMKGGSIDKIYGNGIPEIPLAYITKRVIIGLKQLKDEQNIIHRDVKPTNMLVNEFGKVKLCDFGVSGNLVASLARTNIGCQSYMAPERIKHTNPDVSTYSVQSDIWSLGLSILEISKGCYPYPPETYNNVFSQLSAIVDGEPPELPNGKFSLEAQDFVKQCLHKNPKKRPNYGQLLLHPWLNMYDDLQGQTLLKQIVDISLEQRKEGKNDDSKKAIPALHSGLQV